VLFALRILLAGPLILAGAFLLAACGDDSDDPSPTETEEAIDLATYVCLEEDVPDTYLPQTDGTLQPDDLAALTEDPEEREELLDQIGMEEGYLSYWREEPPKPPFEDPNHLFCQALLFADEAGAALYLDSIRPLPQDVAATAVTFLPESAQEVEEVTAEAGLGPGSRAFILRAEDEGETLIVNILMRQIDRYVLSVLQGGSAEVPSLEESAAILDSMAARIE
jgi:hypothetical protein